MGRTWTGGNRNPRPPTDKPRRLTQKQPPPGQDAPGQNWVGTLYGRSGSRGLGTAAAQ